MLSAECSCQAFLKTVTLDAQRRATPGQNAKYRNGPADVVHYLPARLPTLYTKLYATTTTATQMLCRKVKRWTSY